MTTEEVGDAVLKFSKYLHDNGVNVSTILVRADDTLHTIGYPDEVERSFLHAVAYRHNMKVLPK